METFLWVVLIYLLGYILSYISLKLFITKICKIKWTYGDRFIALRFSLLSYAMIIVSIAGFVCVAIKKIGEKYKINKFFDINNDKPAKW